MDLITETSINCPYCGEQIHVLVNTEDAGVEYIEDCQVCCRPISILPQPDGNGGFNLVVRGEDDTY